MWEGIYVQCNKHGHAQRQGGSQGHMENLLIVFWLQTMLSNSPLHTYVCAHRLVLFSLVREDAPFSGQ